MQLLFEFAPLLAFFVAYRIGGIYAATATLMLAMLLLVAVDLVRLGRVPPMHLLSAVLVLVLGGITLVLRDTRFLKWKPTLFLWGVALVAIGSRWIGARPLAQRSMQPLIPGSELLPRSVWINLTWIWAAFCAVLGAANLGIAFTAPEATWVHFKVFGLTAAIMLFSMAQAVWISSRSTVTGGSTS